MEQAPVQVAVAILYRDGQYLMQLRDDRPDIIYPKRWAFFGGHLEPGETPEAGLLRELMEEIGYAPPYVTPFRQWIEGPIHRHIYHAPLTVPVEALQLNEGWDLALLSPGDIHRGDRYSPIANQVCLLGSPHRDILLDFLAHPPQSAAP
jgi:8-oxo-dGTP diphosphatase